MQDAWIDRNGTRHPVPDYGHCEKALELGDPSGGRNLEDRGWAHCSLGNIYIFRAPSQAQLDALFDFVDAWQDAADADLMARVRAARYAAALEAVLREFGI